MLELLEIGTVTDVTQHQLAIHSVVKSALIAVRTIIAVRRITETHGSGGQRCAQTTRRPTARTDGEATLRVIVLLR